MRAAYLRRRVIVEDIAIHRNWIGFLELAHQAGLRACWSEPIYSSTGSVLGTFAMYYGTPREPDESDLRSISDVAHLAAIAIERANTQKAVLDSETRYKELFESARDVILSIDIHGKILTINPRVVELTGYTREELIGASAFDKLIMPEDHHIAEDVIKGLVDGQNQTYDIRWITKDGCIISLEGTSSSRCDREGKFIATHCIMRDVTERKQAEALQHAQHRVVELLHIDVPLEEVLSDLIRSIEKEVSGVAGSVSLLDEETQCLRFCAGPSLHEDCRRLIDGVEVGPKAPPCGITVFANQELVVEDIASDTRCAACADVATGHGLHACRPFPLRDQDGHAMGVFVAHFTTKIHPTEPMMKWITSAVQIAAIAIERWRAH